MPQLSEQALRDALVVRDPEVTEAFQVALAGALGSDRVRVEKWSRVVPVWQLIFDSDGDGMPVAYILLSADEEGWAAISFGFEPRHLGGAPLRVFHRLDWSGETATPTEWGREAGFRIAAELLPQVMVTGRRWRPRRRRQRRQAKG